jgi:hypothetical protein
MSDINFHQVYKGREDNRYTYKIQKLYEYQYLLQEITKKIHQFLKQMPSYKNRNNGNINSEINEITNQYDIKKKDFDFILIKFYEMRAKSEPLDLDKLFSVRNVLIKRIETLQRSIERLPVPQNNNIFSNLENNQSLTLLKPKSKSETEKMTEKEKLKMQRKRAEKFESKRFRSNNLRRTGYSKENEKESRNHLKEIREDERYRLENEEESRKYKKWYEYPESNNNNNLNNYSRYGPMRVWNGTGYRNLWGDAARAYNDGLWNEID